MIGVRLEQVHQQRLARGGHVAEAVTVEQIHEMGVSLERRSISVS